MIYVLKNDLGLVYIHEPLKVLDHALHVAMDFLVTPDFMNLLEKLEYVQEINYGRYGTANIKITKAVQIKEFIPKLIEFIESYKKDKIYPQ